MKKIIIGFLIVLISGCATLSPDEKRDLELIKFSREIKDETEVGRQMAAKIIGHFKTYKNQDEVYEYVNLVGKTIATCVGRPEISYYFAILDEEEINAFATPGGYVFITTGLLKSIKNESELAAIISHEIAHINEKHMYKEICPKREVSASESIVRAIGRGGSDLGGSIFSVVNKGLSILFEKGLSHEVEFSADVAATQYLSHCGYDPLALRNMLERFENEKKTVSVYKVHPPLKKRIENLDNLIKTEKLISQPLGNIKVMEKRFKAKLNILKET